MSEKDQSEQASGCQEMHFEEIKDNVEKRIAAARAEGIAEGRRLEREACVKLVESMLWEIAVDRHDRCAIVDAIRAAQPDAKEKP